ncbi:peptidoglycan recognition protein family protein [Methylobacterium trifolii]|uniref:N-acetylmuramoyl-L-alanine amidase n=1 Tax=Methylobacterium trifolii TaxID=1003092 RepID=A0ABQ4U6P8_9HYPH|nr:N-acetylmuramoyl-L-alanine amidase [Methylobacterium trifolii]GJE62048.1 hypothetical protein MPOCJGCO_4177 [Methylobacterium trifolii]
MVNEPDANSPNLVEWDERDEKEGRADPNPRPRPFPFQVPPFWVSAGSGTAPDDAPPAAGLTVAVVNRVLPDEAVPACRISVGAVSATTAANGVAVLDLAALGEGRHAITVTAPDVFAGPVGPGFPVDPSKERVWRPFSGTVQVAGGRLAAAEPADCITILDKGLRVRLGPVWLRAPLVSARPGPPDMIVIHHTAGRLDGDLRTFLYSGQVSIHYLVAPDGEVYKLAAEGSKAAHAGTSAWQGAENLNGASIGIEMTHRTGVEYPVVQVDAVVDLVRRIKAAYPRIPPGRVVAHSDIGLCDPGSRNPCQPAAPKRLGRKSTDPGSAFPWERIEALGLGFQFADGVVRPDIYGGFFQRFPRETLRDGDGDAERRYGGVVRPDVSGAVRGLQGDLKALGYFCPPDGEYGTVTAMAVRMFQQRVFSGTRRIGRPDGFNSGDGRFDLSTAHYLKRAHGETRRVFGEADAPSRQGGPPRARTGRRGTRKASASIMLLGFGALMLGCALILAGGRRERQHPE